MSPQWMAENDGVRPWAMHGNADASRSPQRLLALAPEQTHHFIGDSIGRPELVNGLLAGRAFKTSSSTPIARRLNVFGK
jgi:hypothetical protein